MHIRRENNLADILVGGCLRRKTLERSSLSRGKGAANITAATAINNILFIIYNLMAAAWLSAPWFILQR